MSRCGAIFRKHGTDKDTNHSYGPVYDLLFPDAERYRLVMEVGIASGAGLLAYREIFPNAQIVGFDKEPCHRPEVGSEDAAVYPLCPRPSRLEIHQGDLRVPADLLRAVNGRLFDLIVEDATHILEDNLVCYETLWPCVAPGGIYLVEEFANVHAHVEMLKSMGAELYRTAAPIEGELLVVWRKA